MKNTTDYAAAAQKNEPHAHAVIRKSGIIPAWKNIGAEINLVGSLKIGTLGKHPDIDFHTYTPELDIRQQYLAAVFRPAKLWRAPQQIPLSRVIRFSHPQTKPAAVDGRTQSPIPRINHSTPSSLCTEHIISHLVKPAKRKKRDSRLTVS